MPTGSSGLSRSTNRSAARSLRLVGLVSAILPHDKFHHKPDVLFDVPVSSAEYCRKFSKFDERNQDSHDHPCLIFIRLVLLYSNSSQLPMMFMTAGPRITTTGAGNMKNTIGNNIVVGILQPFPLHVAVYSRASYLPVSEVPDIGAHLFGLDMEVTNIPKLLLAYAFMIFRSRFSVTIPSLIDFIQGRIAALHSKVLSSCLVVL